MCVCTLSHIKKRCSLSQARVTCCMCWATTEATTYRAHPQVGYRESGAGHQNNPKRRSHVVDSETYSMHYRRIASHRPTYSHILVWLWHRFWSTEQTPSMDTVRDIWYISILCVRVSAAQGREYDKVTSVLAAWKR